MPVSLPSLSPRKTPHSGRTLTPRKTPHGGHSGKYVARKPTMPRSAPCIRTLGRLRNSSANRFLSLPASRISSSSSRFASNGTSMGGALNSARTSVTQISIISQRSSRPITSSAIYPCKKKKERRPLCQSGRIASHRLPKDGEDAAHVLSTVLLIRGISSRTENFPLPERPEDVLPQHYLESVKEALSSYVSSSSASGMSSPSNDETVTPNALVLATSHGGHSGWTTGNSTERSSLFSWADDEFDKQAAQTVQKMFDEIDDMLFEEQKNAITSTQIQIECKEWNARFPHLRVLGQQLLTPGDLGYQLYPGVRPATAPELLDVADYEVPGNASPVLQGLSISGKHLDSIKVPSPDMASSRGDFCPDPTLAYLEEEIIESDGFIEEYLAYDHYQDDEEHERKRYHAPRRKGFPPVTPNACMQNTVLSQTFDVLWAEVVVWMRQIVRKHSDLHLEGNQEDLSAQMSALRPVVPPFDDDLSYSPTPFGQGTGRTMDMHSSKLAPMTSSMRLGGGGSFNFGIQPEQRSSVSGGLNSLITISSKALHNRPSERAPSALGGEDPSMFGLNATRPGSSSFVPRSNRPGSVRASEFSYNNMRQPSARGGRKGQLKPLDNRAKTPQLKEGMVTGKKIATANDRLGSPPHPAASPPHWSRNATLPPIEVTLQENSTNQFPMRPMKSQNKFRISSAIVDDRGLRPRDRAGLVYNAFAMDSRPNTTHTFRQDDTPFGFTGRRSSTPHAFSMMKPPSSATGNRANVPGGITGVSLGIPGSQSHLDTSSVGPYNGPQPNYFRVL